MEHENILFFHAVWKCLKMKWTLGLLPKLCLLTIELVMFFDSTAWEERERDSERERDRKKRHQILQTNLNRPKPTVQV